MEWRREAEAANGAIHQACMLAQSHKRDDNVLDLLQIQPSGLWDRKRKESPKIFSI